MFWLLTVITCLFFAVSIFSRSKREDHSTKQSATASGNSIIIQAGGSVTIVNPGVHEDTERARLRDESGKWDDRLAQKYPLGYALIGIANGKIVHEMKVKGVRFTGDWENWRIVIDNEGRPLARLIVSKLEIDGWRVEDSSIEVPYYDGAVARMGWLVRGVYTYFEVIDTKENLFAIGFSDQPLS